MQEGLMGEERLLPRVAVIADSGLIGQHLTHSVYHKYLHALTVAAKVAPIIVPAFYKDNSLISILSVVDGICLTGSNSMVNPHYYDEKISDPTFTLDTNRDKLSFALVRQALHLGLPLLGICRGCQDVNVALDGSLYQQLHNEPYFNDHREDKSSPLKQQYIKAHSVKLQEEGLLVEIMSVNELQVNSLHTQGIKKLANGLSVEAIADDGLIEAFRINQLDFGLCVQWHPEWQVEKNPLQKKLFQAFGQACSERAKKRLYKN